VARTVVAPPSSVVKCLWEVLVWGVVLVVCVCVSSSWVVFSVGVCVCDLLIFLPPSVGMRMQALQLLTGKVAPPRAAEPLYRALRAQTSEY